MPEADGRGEQLVLAVDLGATNLRCGLVDGNGTVRARESIPTPFDASLAPALQVLARRVRGSSSVDAAVIGVPGRVDYASGRLAWGRGQPESWPGILTEESLGRLLDIPAALANDADLATVGEATFGAAAGRHDVAYLTISSGVGAGAIVGGRLLRGRVKLCEIALTLLSIPADGTGEPILLEDLASGRALERMAREAGIDGRAPEIVAKVQLGDDAAKRVWEAYTRAVGTAVVNIAHLFVPEIVVIGGGVSRAGELLLGPVREWLLRYGPQDLAAPIDVAVAALADDAGLVGAAAWGRATADG
jgi:glucokinase